MGCAGCSTKTANGLPAGCRNNGSCLTGGCGKLETYDWLSNIYYAGSVGDDQIYEVKFKGTRKGFYLSQGIPNLEIGDAVVVDATSGYDVGFISLTGELVKWQMKKQNVEKGHPGMYRIQRKAGERELEKLYDARERELETMLESRKIASSLRLDMKIGDVEYQADGSKAIFYYTAEGRVDFRELIKQLARNFRIKVEMRQIGLRQEAGRIGGIGSCGRELCCSTWLTDFDSVSITAARYQNLFLNPLKLSGQCGRLKCCLNYELDQYLEALDGFPGENTRLQTVKGNARIFKTDILKQLILFQYESSDEAGLYPVTVAMVNEVIKMNKEGKKPNDLDSISIAPAHNLEDAEPGYKSALEDDSLNRFDNQDKGKKKRKKKRKKKKPANEK